MLPRDDQSDQQLPPANDGAKPGGRLNLLLSYSGWHQSNPIEQLPRLLTPMGIFSYTVASCDEAEALIRDKAIHIAVVDLGIPLQRKPSAPQAGQSTAAGSSGGARILQLLRRLDQPPPTVVIRPSHSTTRESQRTLCDAMREGAFAVLDAPLRLETMLETMRRVLRRHYADNWPRN